MHKNSTGMQILLRGLALHVEAQRGGDRLQRHLSRSGLTLLRDLALIRGLTTIGRVADHLLVPSFRAIEVRAPIFVVAPPRSGTSLLYNLLAGDPRFVGPRLYESIFPSLCLLGAIEGLSGRVNRLSGGRLLNYMERLERETFSDFDSSHRSRYRELEEDTPLFDRFMACPSAFRFFPFAERLPEMASLDEQAPAARCRVMAAYRGSIQRFLHRAPPGSTYIAKNISSFGRIASLLEAFPDARLIHIVRHPYSVIASTVQLFQSSAYLGLSREDRPIIPANHPQLRFCADAVIRGYDRLLGWQRRLPPERWLTLRFEELIADPQATTRRVYRHFGISMSTVAEANLRERAAAARSFRSKKGERFSLESCGYTRAGIHAALREVFEFYKFDPEAPG